MDKILATTARNTNRRRRKTFSNRLNIQTKRGATQEGRTHRQKHRIRTIPAGSTTSNKKLNEILIDEDKSTL